MIELTCRIDCGFVPSELEECTTAAIRLVDQLSNHQCRLMDRGSQVSPNSVLLCTESSLESQICPRWRNNWDNKFVSS